MCMQQARPHSLRIQSRTVTGAGVPSCHGWEMLATLCGNTVMFKTCYGRIQRIWTKCQDSPARVSQTKKSDAHNACHEVIRPPQRIPTNRPSTTGCFGRGGVRGNSSPIGSPLGLIVAARPLHHTSPRIAILAQGSQSESRRAAETSSAPAAMVPGQSSKHYTPIGEKSAYRRFPQVPEGKAKDVEAAEVAELVKVEEPSQCTDELQGANRRLPRTQDMGIAYAVSTQEDYTDNGRDFAVGEKATRVVDLICQ